MRFFNGFCFTLVLHFDKYTTVHKFYSLPFIDYFKYLTLPHLIMQVNNVGTNRRKPTTEYSADDYSFIMSTNLESAYHLCQLAHPLLKASGLASIVFISSVSGVVGISSGSVYGMTKGNCWSAKRHT